MCKFYFFPLKNIFFWKYVWAILFVSPQGTWFVNHFISIPLLPLKMSCSKLKINDWTVKIGTIQQNSHIPCYRVQYGNAILIVDFRFLDGFRCALPTRLRWKPVFNSLLSKTTENKWGTSNINIFSSDGLHDILSANRVARVVCFTLVGGCLFSLNEYRSGVKPIFE